MSHEISYSIVDYCCVYDFSNRLSINANVLLASPIFCFPKMMITTNETRVNVIVDSFGGGDAAVVECDAADPGDLR